MEKDLAEIASFLKEKGLTVSTAESFTSGAVAKALTSVPGASEYFKGGVVAYSEQIKCEVLDVKTKTLEDKGAVHVSTAIEMAQGASKLMSSDYALATTGLAGPGGGTPEIPVGTVHLAILGPGYINSYTDTIKGSREAVVESATALILKRFRNVLSNSIE
jgi:nicotinamide-nucleotide amidase